MNNLGAALILDSYEISATVSLLLYSSTSTTPPVDDTAGGVFSYNRFQAGYGERDRIRTPVAAVIGRF